MGGIRTPRSVTGAQTLCERFAAIEASVDLIEAERAETIAKANATADAQIEPLIAEREQIREKLEPWWAKDGGALVKKDQKSIELGGCTIGTATGKEALDVPVRKDADAAKAELGGTKWGKSLLRTTVSFDKRAIAKAMADRHGEALRALGFAIVPAPETFVLKRAEQRGTRG